MDLTKKVNVLFAALVPAVGLAGSCGPAPEDLQPCTEETEEVDCGAGRYCDSGQCADYKEGQQPQGYTCEDAARNSIYNCPVDHSHLLSDQELYESNLQECLKNVESGNWNQECINYLSTHCDDNTDSCN